MFKHLFEFVTLEDIVRTDKGAVFIGKNRITEQEKLNLISEAKLIKSTRLWHLLTQTLKYDAQERMFKNSKDYQDLLNGKMMLYNISIQENLIKFFSEM